MFFNNFDNISVQLEKVASGVPNAKKYLFYLPGFRDHFSTRKKPLHLFASDVCGIYGTNLPNHGQHFKKRGLITPMMGKLFVQQLAKEIHAKFYNLVVANQKTLVLMGHSTGVTMLIEMVQYLPLEMQKRCGIVGISPAFFVDHNVPRFVRALAPLLRFYPHKLPISFDPGDVTDCPRARAYICGDRNVDHGAAYAQTLYTIHKTGQSAWKHVVGNEIIPMRFLHGENDSIAKYPPYLHCRDKSLVRAESMSGRHDVTLQKDITLARLAITKLQEYTNDVDACVRHRHAVDSPISLPMNRQLIPVTT